MNYQELRKKISDFFTDKYVQITLYLFFIVAVIASVYIAFENVGSHALLKQSYEHVNIKGQYSIDGGNTYSDFEDYNEIDLRGVNDLIIKGRIHGGLHENEALYMYMDHIYASLYVNGSIVYVSDERAAYCWDAVRGTDISGADIITIELKTKRNVIYPRGFRDFLNRINKSSKAEVLSHELRRSAPWLIGDVMLFVLGFIMIMSGCEAHFSTGENTYGMLSCGMATILGSVDCFIQPNYITLMFPEYEMVEYMDSLLQALTVLFIFVYFQKFLKEEKNQRSAGGLVVVYYIVVCVYLLWSSISYPVGNMPVVFAVGAGVLVSLQYIWLFIKDSKNVKDRGNFIALGASGLLLICIFLEMFIYLYAGIFAGTLFEIGLLAFGFVQFAFIVGQMAKARKESRRLSEIENELTRAQVNSMISQIGPHFLYNALSTIRALCLKYPDKARDAIDLLSKYLRANMESLTIKECIPITKELEHVDCYLGIEKYRFGDKLKVEYDIKSTNFGVPSMTVQTLAENAVKHGLLAKPEGGTLKISTSESDYCYVVNIEDDGVGFDASNGRNENRIHVGIENSRKRLAAMCNGTLSIGSRLGRGTTITICIPKN